MNLVNTTYRTSREEIMDDFCLQGKMLEKILKDLDRVNKWLGGTSITINGMKKILARTSPAKNSIKIMDVGCGNGSMLRELAEFARKKKLKVELKGIDANPGAIIIARKEAKEYPEIFFETMDVFSESFENAKADIILCTLTLHHFKDEEIVKLLKIFLKNSTLGVIINDLHRSRAAYYLFQLFCGVFIKNEIARKDGLTSILRGFKKKELEKFSGKLDSVSSEISWKWAFRYQWIITSPTT